MLVQCNTRAHREASHTLRAVPWALLSVSLATDGLVKRLHALIARATAGERHAEYGGSRGVWQYRGRFAPPLITSDLVVSPFQVEPPSDVTALGHGTRCSSFIYANMSVGACFSALSLGRQWRGSSSQIVTDGLMAEDIPDKSLARSSGRHERRRERKVKERAESKLTTPRRTVSEQSVVQHSRGQSSREAQLSLFSGAVDSVGSVETSLRFSWKLSICLVFAALLLPLPPSTMVDDVSV